MQQRIISYITPQEYLALERSAETKSEYWNGQIYAMSGASREHNLISLNTASSLHAQTKGRPCEIYSSDMRVKVNPTGLYTYPDVVVVCGKVELEDDHVDTLLNPTVIIEVLSKSTESYDRGTKFEHYHALDSLTDYLLISQTSYAVDHYVRQEDDRWLLTAHRGLDTTLSIPAIACQLSLADVYDRIELVDSSHSASLTVFKEQAVEYTL